MSSRVAQHQKHFIFFIGQPCRLFQSHTRSLHFLLPHPKDSPSSKKPEVQSLVSDPRVHSIDGPMCRRSLKSPGSNDKAEFMRKPTRWLTSSKEIAEILRGNGRWKPDRRNVRMTGKSETACEYLAVLVVALWSVLKRQMMSDGAIRGGELHFSGPVPDESGCSIELRGQLSADGTWIDQKLLMEGRKEEMLCMRKMGVFEVVVLRQRLQASRIGEGGQD